MKKIITCYFIFVTLFINAQVKDKYDHIADSMKQNGYEEKIIPYMQKELKAKPKNEKLLRILGYTYIERNELELGEKYYKEALIVNPSCGKCYLNLANIYSIRKDNKTTLEMLDKAVSIDPKDPEFYLIRAQFKSVSGDKFGTLADYNKSIELAPENAVYYVERGKYNAVQGYASLALADYDMAIKIDSASFDAHYARASIYYEKRMMKEAMEDVTAAIRFDSTKQSGYVGRGAIYDATNELDKAVADYTKAIQLKPEDHFAYYNRAMTKYKMEDMDAYCEDLNESYTRLMKYAPQDSLKKELETAKNIYCDATKASYYYQRGVANYNLGKMEKAVAIYSDGLKKFPTNGMMLSFRGNAYLAKGEYANALADYNAAILNKENIMEDIKLNQQNEQLKNQSLDQFLNATIASIFESSAEAAFGMGQLDEAILKINKGIELIGDMSGFGREQYFNVRGSILSEQGKYQQALNDFNKAIQINSSLATAYANRAITKINMMANTKTISYSLKLNTKDHQTITPSWSSPAKFSNKKNESTYFAAMADCDRAIELDPKLDNAYYIRGKIKKIIQYGDYCYDLLKAQTLGFPVEQELLTGCK